MKLNFETRALINIPIKKNGTITKVIKYYTDRKIPMRQFLTDYLAVKSKGDNLAKAFNPWSYLYKGIEKHEIEEGISVDETVFRFGAMELTNQAPTEVINAAFYANKKRNDSSFEIGYLLPEFLQIVDDSDNILVVNPSPDIIIELQSSEHSGDISYAVTDETVAKLYSLQFPSTTFVSFEKTDSIHNIDAVLIINRDQKLDNASLLLNSLRSCTENAFAVLLVPSAWFDNPKSGASAAIASFGMSINQILIVDTGATVTAPRKKILALLDTKNSPAITLSHSDFDSKSKVFSVKDGSVSIDASTYLNSDKTILSLWKSAVAPVNGGDEPKYSKSTRFCFSEEISLFYKIYSGRKNRVCGIGHYREITDISPLRWGRKISPDLEKGLRAKSEDEVIAALDNLVFNDSLYLIIRSDIEKNYIDAGKPISLKTLWFYCWIQFENAQKYDHQLVRQLMQEPAIANYHPQTESGAFFLEQLSKSLNIDQEEIPLKIIEQFNIVLSNAIRQKLIVYNPLEKYLSEYSRKATERQQDVRNALVKKHFNREEEAALFTLLLDDVIEGCKYPVLSSSSLATVIRMFSGMAIREVAALKWQDFSQVPGTDLYQFRITKYVDKNGNILSYSDKASQKRIRLVPASVTISILLVNRKNHLISLGIEEKYLDTCPIIMSETQIDNMRVKNKIHHIKPGIISSFEKGLISKVISSENIVVLPDDVNELITDFNRYHGDIFLSNFRHKANHNAYLTIGEINYLIGINAPDTFSHYYCDYTNDFLQYAIVQKLRRWEAGYENIVRNTPVSVPNQIEKSGDFSIDVGPFPNGVTTLDIIIENASDTKLSVNCEHGYEISKTEYGG